MRILKILEIETLVRFCSVFFFFLCTSSILYNEHCEVTPWIRMKGMLMTVLEFVLVLWIALWVFILCYGHP